MVCNCLKQDADNVFIFEFKIFCNQKFFQWELNLILNRVFSRPEEKLEKIVENRKLKQYLVQQERDFR